jgi:hypothetical protein
MRRVEFPQSREIDMETFLQPREVSVQLGDERVHVRFGWVFGRRAGHELGGMKEHGYYAPALCMVKQGAQQHASQAGPHGLNGK